MYTIKQASIRTGVSVPLLRAWERRYGIPRPARTDSGYRLYDEAALDAVRRMRQLVTSGWPPSQAARSVLERGAGNVADPETAEATTNAAAGEGTETSRAPAGGPPAAAALVRAFVAAARTVDEASLERTLDEAFAALGVDEAIRSVALPGLAAIGASWASGGVDVAGEHAASEVVMRRFGALYEAAGGPAGEPDVLVGLPPGSRHEAGALAFAVACRRSGLNVLYLGADVPVESWRRVADERPATAIVLAAVTAAEAASASAVVAALRGRRRSLVAVGGASADVVRGDVLRLPPDPFAAAVALRAAIEAAFPASLRSASRGQLPSPAAEPRTS